jgi:hypothetical protein
MPDLRGRRRQGKGGQGVAVLRDQDARALARRQHLPPVTGT